MFTCVLLFKQKTAYEMRISDWSSDVCSSDLHPVLFQAGASDQGRDLAARRAEAIYAVAYDLPASQEYYRDIKRRVREAGRKDPVPIMPGLVTYVGSTDAETRADRKSVVSGKSVSVRVDLGGRGHIKKKN